MKVKTIPSTWLRRNGRRFDCGPYTAGALEAKIRLDELDAEKQPLHELTLDGLDGIYHAGREGRTWVESEDYGVRFVGSSAVLRADLSKLPYLLRAQVQRNPKFLLGSRWTLITRSGTIGRMVYSRPDMAGMACSEHVMRVVPDASVIHPGFVYAYLSSKFGVPLVVSGTYGSIIQSIEPQHLAQLPVPRLGERVEAEVGCLMDEAAELVAKYQALVVQATVRLFESVGLTDISGAQWHGEGPDLGFEVEFPKHESLRGLNYTPRFQRLCDRIKSGPWRSLGDICVPGTLKRGGRFKRIDADPQYAYRLIGQRHLFWLQPEGRWIAKFALNDSVLVDPGTVLIAAQGTLGENELYSRAEFAWGPGVELAYSEHILRAIADETVMPRGCLFAFLRSETAFRMLRSISVGSKLQDHHYAFKDSLPVPYPDATTQLEIHRLVVDAYEKRHQGVALEEEARALVERAIEEAT